MNTLTAKDWKTYSILLSKANISDLNMMAKLLVERKEGRK